MSPSVNDLASYGDKSAPRNVKLSARDITVTYSGRGDSTFTAVKGIDLDIKDGEFVVVVGPSGSGKSSFLMALDSLLPLASGTVSVSGREVTRPGRERAVVFQDASLLPWRTVLDNVAYGLELARRPKAERHEIARQMIELAGLKGYEESYPAQLSGGQRQRVNIARALASDPEVLFLDEPFSGLDAQTRETMQSELLKIWDERKKTALFVTHQIDEAVYLADRVVAFSASPARIVQEWVIPFERPRPLELKQTPEHREIEKEIWQVVRHEGTLSRPA